MRPHIHPALFGLLACSGLRISEALHLNRDEVDLTSGRLMIRETKFCKSRIVPLHPTALLALNDLTHHRDRIVPKPQCDRFWINDYGRELPYSTVRCVFRKLCDQLRLTMSGKKPRLHDFRHTFACRRIESWSEAGIDLSHAVASLSTYLGHVKVTDTYWYLTATPELLARAANRFVQFADRTNEEESP